MKTNEPPQVASGYLNRVPSPLAILASRGQGAARTLPGPESPTLPLRGRMIKTARPPRTEDIVTRSCYAKMRWTRTVLGMALIICLSTSAKAQRSGESRTASIDSATSMIYEGFTEPQYDIMVAADELGRLDSIDVEIGDLVEAGQVIGKLEDSLQLISVELARMQSEMTGELDATKAEVERNRSRTLQLRQLVANEMARPDELLRAETDLRIAVARHAAAIEQAELRKLEVRRFEMQVDRRKVRVPRAGVVADVFHHPGEYITPADPAIIRLMVIDKLYAVFNVPVEDTNAMRVGNRARVFLRSSATTREATVTSIAPHIDGESGTVKVRVELDNPDRQLRSGDRCTLQILPGRTGDAGRSASRGVQSAKR